MSQDQVNEELRLFLEKHGKEPAPDEPDEIQQQKQTGLNFYAGAHDNRLEMLEENDHEMLLDEANDDDLLQDVEDDMAAFINQPKPAPPQYAKRSPNVSTSNTRKG